MWFFTSKNPAEIVFLLLRGQRELAQREQEGIMRLNSSNIQALSDIFYNTLQPVSKEEVAVMIDQVEEFRKMMVEQEKYDRMQESLSADNGAINAGIDSIHALFQFKRIMDDSDLSKNLFNNYDQALKNDINLFFRLVA